MRRADIPSHGFSLQSALVALGATIAAAVPTLQVEGNQFVNNATGDAFQIVGVAYQIGGSAGYDPSAGKDPLSNGDVCKRDAALLQALGVNTIRVYNLDPDLNHDECASVFNAAGMYMLIDVNSPLVGEALNSQEPWTTYTASYLNRTFAIVEAFKSYPNLLGFFAGNEVVNDVATGEYAPAYVRAVIRDLKNYIKKHASRSIPVGYSAADVRTVLEDTFNYFQCSIKDEDDDISRADMFALNSYSWCGNSTFTESGYDKLVAMFEKSSVPVFYSEFGCNTPSPRVFTEIQAIYGSEMTSTFSGGVVYEFSQEANDYGLVTVNDDNSIDLLSDYGTLLSQYEKVDWTSVESVAASGTTNTPPVCTSTLITEDGFDNNFTLPVIIADAEKILENGVSPAPSGSIIDISDYSFKYAIRDANGNTLSVVVSPLAEDTFNTVGLNNATHSTTSNSTSTSDSSASTTSSKNAAIKSGANLAAIAIPVIAGLMAAI
ncbi:Glucanosyltransferase-domain-containing protein [Xylariales sp. PMI_506]|nr:Glucanosyltransferase-domain-containing protein [Xylariales sp. PMI_506]